MISPSCVQVCFGFAVEMGVDRREDELELGLAVLAEAFGHAEGFAFDLFAVLEMEKSHSGV